MPLKNEPHSRESSVEKNIYPGTDKQHVQNPKYQRRYVFGKSKVTIEENSEKPKQRRRFWWCFILSFAALTGILLIFKYLDFINWFPAFFIFFFILMFSCRVYKGKLDEPFHYLKPLIIAVSVSFAVVHFTFGVHGDAFASYDNEVSSSDTDRYKWFKAEDVLTFPISQLDFKNNPSTTNIDIGSLKDTASTYNIIIIDKTKSVTEQYQNLNDLIINRIKTKFILTNVTKKTIDKYKTVELIPPFLISGLIEDKMQSQSNDFVDIMYYSGNKSDSLISLVHTESVDKIYSDTGYISKYFTMISGLDKTKSDHQTTSFKEIADALRQTLLHDPYPGKDVNVSIISDFINTNPNENIPDFSKIGQIKGLNLYMLDGNEPNSQKDAGIQLIKKMVNRFSYLHRKTIINFKEVDYHDFAKVKKFYDNELWMSSLHVFDQRSDRSIPFYSPFFSFRNNQAAVGNIMFKDRARYSLKVTDLDSAGADFPIIFNTDYDAHNKNSDSVIFPAEIFNIDAGPKDVLKISLPYAFRYRNDRIFIDITSHTANKTYVLPVSFRPLLPETTSYYLVVCYTVFVVSISLILMLPNYLTFLLILKNKVECSYHYSWVLAIPVAVGTAFLFYYFYMLLFSHKNLWFLFVLVLLATLSFTIPSAVYDFEETIKAPDNSYTFDPWLFFKKIKNWLIIIRDSIKSW